jgi:hypothetical protein
VQKIRANGRNVTQQSELFPHHLGDNHCIKKHERNRNSIMRKIGLIGGMSFESSAVYYRMINEAVRERLGGLHSAEVMLHSVDFQTIVDLQKAGRWDDAAKRLSEVAQGLEASQALAAF